MNNAAGGSPKKTLFRGLLMVVFIFLAIVFYVNTNFFIRNQGWKYRNGSTIGDWISFDNSFYSIKGRSIYRNNTRVGNIVFCQGNMLVILEARTKEKGYYINK